jgi:ubiquinone/menaquinone biosynthesis C-methylase UbiE
MHDDSESGARGVGALAPGARFHEAIARSWSAGYRRGNFKRRLAVFAAILDRRVQRGDEWLDLGCGSGVLTAELAQRGAEVVALDGAPSMLQAARQAAFPDGAQVQFRLGDATALSWCATPRFDGVLCSSVIEYVRDGEALLTEASRVLKDGGTLVISVPPRGSVLRSAQRIARRALRRFGKDAYAYLDVSVFEVEPRALPAMFERAGLRLERVTPFDALLPRPLLSVFRPSLLICEARKAKAG